MDAINEYQQEPGDLRRVILLLSQAHHDGSKASEEEIIRSSGRSSTTVYSITFSISEPKFRSEENAAKPSRENRRTQLSSANTPMSEANTESTPLGTC
jgi:hypothetical protein